MKYTLSFLVVILSFISCFSQIEFETGYFITNEGNRIECEIKNQDWLSFPRTFKYRLLNSSEIESASIDNVKEFGISSYSKYIRSIVNIDISSSDIGKLSKDKKPIFKKEEVFLKVLLEGKSSLYEYVSNNIVRYFYNLDGSSIQQLVHKEYITPDNKIGRNNEFRRQLWSNLKCASFNMRRYELLKYKRSDLIRIFTDYHKCHDAEFINFIQKNKKDLFNLNIRPRINSANYSVENFSNSIWDFDFGSKLTYGLGLEAEFILPFNKNKWRIMLESSYQNFSSNSSKEAISLFGEMILSEINYNSLNFALGLRYYIFLNKKNKLFANAVFSTESTLNSRVIYSRENGNNLRALKLGKNSYASAGIGFKLGEKISAELRYHSPRNLFVPSAEWRSEYREISLILGYSLL